MFFVWPGYHAEYWSVTEFGGVNTLFIAINYKRAKLMLALILESIIYIY